MAILNLDCQFCLAVRQVDIGEGPEGETPPGFRKAAADWIKAHRACVPKGDEVRINVTGQKDAEAPKIPVVMVEGWRPNR